MNTVDRKLAKQIDLYRQWAMRTDPTLSAAIEASIAEEISSQAGGNPPTGVRYRAGSDDGNFGDASGQPDFSYNDVSFDTPAPSSSDSGFIDIIPPQPLILSPTPSYQLSRDTFSFTNLFPWSRSVSDGGVTPSYSSVSGGASGLNTPSPSLLGIINNMSATVNTALNDVMIPVTTLLNAKIKINTLKAQATAAAGGAAATGQGTAAFTNALGSSPLIWAVLGIGGLALVLGSSRRR